MLNITKTTTNDTNNTYYIRTYCTDNTHSAHTAM